MASDPAVPLDLRCPDASCRGVMARDECGIFCSRCGFEAVTWADPVDADVPMDVILRRERSAMWKRRALLGSAAAAILTVIGWALSGWVSGSSSGAAERTPLRDLRTLSYADLKAGFASGSIPADWDVPAFYRDPERFLMPRERSAQSVLGPIWQGYSKEEKLGLLEIARELETVELLGPLVDISWYVTPVEQDYELARSLMDALYLSTGNFAEVGILACQHIATTTPNADVRGHAQRYMSALDERLRRLGR
jgi:hypothetical protein